MQISGRIRMVGSTIQVSQSFKKREIVITTEEQYPQHILIDFTQDKCDLLNQFQIGETVKVHINLRGREWVNPQGETRFFNTIQGWQIERLNFGNVPQYQQPQQTQYQQHTQQPQMFNNYGQTPNNNYQQPQSSNEADQDDLPF